jgi:hypothetical protein
MIGGDLALVSLALDICEVIIAERVICLLGLKPWLSELNVKPRELWIFSN